MHLLLKIFNCNKLFFYRGAVLIMGAITLNTWVCALLYHPVEEHMIRVPISEEKGVDNEALTLDEISGSKETPNCVVKDENLRSEIPKESYKPIPEEMLVRDLAQALERLQDSSLIDESPENESNKGDKIKLNESTGTVPSGILNPAFYDSEGELKDNIATVKSINNADPNTSQISRNSSMRHSGIRNKNFRVSRQHSIVSEMGTIPLSPRSNVPGMFKSLFKTHTSKKKHRAAEKPDKEQQSSDEEFDSEIESEKKKFFDLSVLKDPIYLVILISNSTSAISNTNFMILLPSYAISQGFDKNMSALLLSIVSALDLVGRIGGSSLSDIDFVPKYYYFVGGLGMSGISLALLPMANSYTMLSFFCALFGLSSGMYIGITTVILADMLGTEKLTSSYGISLLVNGVLQFIGPPICGVIYEQIGSYKPIFLAFGIILILGTALWAFLPIIKRKNKKEIDNA